MKRESAMMPQWAMDKVSGEKRAALEAAAMGFGKSKVKLFHRKGEGVEACRKLFEGELGDSLRVVATDAEIDEFLSSYCDEHQLATKDVLDSRGDNERDAKAFLDEFKSFMSAKGRKALSESIVGELNKDEIVAELAKIAGKDEDTVRAALEKSSEAYDDFISGQIGNCGLFAEVDDYEDVNQLFIEYVSR